MNNINYPTFSFAEENLSPPILKSGYDEGNLTRTQDDEK